MTGARWAGCPGCLVRVCGVLVVAMGLAAGCSPGTGGLDSGPPPAPAWQSVLEGEAVGGALLSVWGSSPDNVVMVGGARGNGAESLVYRFNGSSLSRLRPGGEETYWWVAGSGATDVYLVGERGRVTRFDGTTFSELPRPTGVTLWGVHAFSPTNVWVVGGTPTGGTGAPNDLVFQWDGTAWTTHTLPGTPRGVSLFKVWGTSDTDLYLVGERGTIWHRDATGFTAVSDAYTPPLALGTLFTVFGCGTEAYAVGGTALLKGSGAAWSAITSSATLRNLNGITCHAGVLTAVGFGGVKVRLSVDGTLLEDASNNEPFLDLHAAFADSNGDVWGVGGDWISPSAAGRPRDGLVARFSARALPAVSN
jgi:hypothetical protein